MSGGGCDEIRALLSAQLDGGLAADEAARVREHLEGCGACREHAEALRLAVEALRRLPDLPPPASILAGVRERLRPVPWHRRILGRRPWLTGVPVGAFATLLVVIGVALFQSRYPRLSQVAEERAPRPPAVTPETRPATTPSQQVPPVQAPAAARKDVSTGAVPAARAPKAAKPLPAAPAAPVTRAPEAPAPAPLAPVPQAPVAPAPVERAPVADAMRREEAAPPAPRFAAPQPVPGPEPIAVAPRSATPPRESGAAGLLEKAGRSIGVSPATGLLKSTAPRPAPEVALPQGPPEQPERLEALTVLLAQGEELDELRRLVQRDGGRVVETRVLDQRARREAFAPHRLRAGLRGEVTQGWQLIVRMPRRALGSLPEEIERRPGRLVLERRHAPAPAGWRPPEDQTLRITVLR